MIIVDYRERGSSVPEELGKLGAALKFENLEAGDYVIGRDICIERKSCSDFLSSLIDKRLFEQARRLVRAYKKPIMLVEGAISDALKLRRIGYPQVYGALAAVVDMGVNVMFVRNPTETAYIIYCLHEKSVQAISSDRVEKVDLVVRKDNRSIEVVQLNMVASIPGVSRELSHRILMHFKTPRRFFKATPSELRRVEGLGRARIVKVTEFLDARYLR